jgi:hypothetical protein
MTFDGFGVGAMERARGVGPRKAACAVETRLCSLHRPALVKDGALECRCQRINV